MKYLPIILIYIVSYVSIIQIWSWTIINLRLYVHDSELIGALYLIIVCLSIMIFDKLLKWIEKAWGKNEKRAQGKTEFIMDKEDSV